MENKIKLRTHLFTMVVVCYLTAWIVTIFDYKIAMPIEIEKRAYVLGIVEHEKSDIRKPMVLSNEDIKLTKKDYQFLLNGE